MNLTYTVHGTADTDVHTVVEIEGEKVRALVAEFVVELTCGGQGTITWRFRGSKIAAAKEAYTQGKEIVLNIPPFPPTE